MVAACKPLAAFAADIGQCVLLPITALVNKLQRQLKLQTHNAVAHSVVAMVKTLPLAPLSESSPSYCI